MQPDNNQKEKRMAPIPPKEKAQLPQQPKPQAVSTNNVYDGLGRSLSSTLRKQKWTNKDHDSRITTNRQHASQYESDLQKDKLIYRDVFPGRKYKLTLSDTTWMGGSNVVTVGYTVANTFTQIFSTAEAPEDNVFEIEIPVVSAVDTLEIRLIGASDTVRGYLEDYTSSSGLGGIIERIVDAIGELALGLDDINDQIDDLQDQIDDLDIRVTALEGGGTPTPEPEPEPEPEPNEE